MLRKDPLVALRTLGAQGDAVAASAFYRVDNLLSDRDEVLAEPALGARVDAFLDGVEEGPDGPGPLPRSEFEALLS